MYCLLQILKYLLQVSYYCISLYVTKIVATYPPSLTINSLTELNNLLPCANLRERSLIGTLDEEIAMLEYYFNNSEYEAAYREFSQAVIPFARVAMKPDSPLSSFGKL